MLAILDARSNASFLTKSFLTLLLISPILVASVAVIISPVKSIFIAFLLDTFLERATIGVEQKRPILTPGVANLDSLDAIAKSQDATS